MVRERHSIQRAWKVLERHVELGTEFFFGHVRMGSGHLGAFDQPLMNKTEPFDQD